MEKFITACMIGKDEESKIERCLSAVSALNIPIVYTDTGSGDRTVEIATKYTENIHHFPWCNDFSKARNFCAEKAETDWIWVIDCDEYVQTADLEQLRAFCLNSSNLSTIGTIKQKDRYLLCGEPTYAITNLGRIYNRTRNHYVGAVHEQILPITAGNLSYFDLDILVDHDGYVSPDILQKKCKRNSELLLEELSNHEDPYLYYQLGKCYTTLGEHHLAAEAFSKGLSFDLDPKLSYVQSMVEAYGYSLLETKQYEVAMSFEGIYDTFCQRADFVFLMGLIYMNNAQFDKAVGEFKKATTYPSCIVEGVNSYRANYNIGVILECLGNTADALPYYEACGNFAPALVRLEELR